jgi:anti-sigma factor RsiW
MNDVECDNARVLIHGHLDGELDLLPDLEVERHIAQCERCSGEYATIRALRTQLKDQSLYFEAPDELTEKIRRAIHRAPPRARAFPSQRRASVPRAIRFAIPIAVAAILTLLIVPRAMRPGRNEILTQEVLASHVRSMMASHLMDVASTDQHTVKPWFNGKLDFSPPVTDFAQDGFPLVGGRLDYIDSRPVAALVYQHGKHVINVFMWPLAGEAAGSGKIQTQQGYNLKQTVVAGMNCWIVSDLNQTELAKFGELLRTRG